MRKALLGLFAASLVIAAFTVFNMMRRSDASVPSQHILAASVALPAGTLLRAQDVTWNAVIEADADQFVRPSTAEVQAKPESVQETEASLYGAVLRHALGAGAPIRRGDIARPGDRDFLQVVLPPSARAIAIPVATGGASTGLLSPGDRVDVILTQNFKNESTQEMHNTPITRRSVGETVVQNLRVLAIDAPETRSTAVATNPANGVFGRTVTLEVAPEQAEKISVAAELGKLSLTLRSVSATAHEAVKPQWAGDVSPALLGAAIEKPIAISPKPILVIRGGSLQVGHPELRRETVKTED